ncbi:MAG: hypothetical protein FJY80_13265, partial [Candidatus Aminicenantes bacterium]|nr:hypothetical protein [Candidatus Aminicenantes bacterium]
MDLQAEAVRPGRPRFPDDGRGIRYLPGRPRALTMSYIALSEKDKAEMLARVGVEDVAGLFRCIPAGVRLDRDLNLPPAMSEPELLDHFAAVAGRTTYPRFLSFLGGGMYHHYIPAVVDSL